MRGASENVKLLVGEMKEADAEMDSRISNAFDNILDSGVSRFCNVFLYVFIMMKHM